METLDMLAQTFTLYVIWLSFFTISRSVCLSVCLFVFLSLTLGFFSERRSVRGLGLLGCGMVDRDRLDIVWSSNKGVSQRSRFFKIILRDQKVHF